ncbi:MAG: NosD domain-containing protein [Candidatus Bathyarchaeia archaeon]
MRHVFLVCMLVLGLAFGFLGFVSNVSVVHAWVGTVYIKSNGDVEPVDAPINTTDKVVYRLWDNINVSELMAKGIVIERDNIILDGNGFTVHGSKFQLTTGVYLEQRNNVTVKNLNVEGHNIGINLHQSVNIKIQGCSITGNTWGIDLKYSNSSIIIGNNLADNGYALRLGSSSIHNTISRNNVTGAGDGIIIQENCNFTIISENYLNGDPSVIATGITISASENKILRNTITSYGAGGISLTYASKNLIYGNDITLNAAAGINLYEYADNNNVAGNTIAWNGYGIRIYMASNNKIFNNVFYKNGLNIEIEIGSGNVFNGGYPRGGNYWSDYEGEDRYHGENQDVPGADGIGDYAYVTDSTIDEYPLMAPLNLTYVGAWEGTDYYISVASNSTVTDILFNPELGPYLRFNVTGLDGTTGFCRITIPKAVLWTENSWYITVNGQKIENYLELTDEENTYLYFTYTHSIKTITIQGTNVIPEYSPATLLTLLLLTTTLAVTTNKKAKKFRDQNQIPQFFR